MDEYNRKINFLVGVRVLLIPVIFCTLHFTDYFTDPGGARAVAFYWGLSAFFVLNLAVWTAGRLAPQLGSAWLFAHIAGDFCLINLILYVTIPDMPENPFPLLLIFVIMYSALFLSMRGVFFVTGISCASYLLNIGLYVWATPSRGLDTPLKSLILLAEVNILSIILGGLLLAFLGERLRASRARIAQQSMRIQDLSEYNEYILENIRSGLLTTNQEFSVVKINQMGEKLLGGAAGEILGANAFDLFRIPEGDREGVQFPPGEQRAARLEKWMDTAPGAGVYMGISISPILVRSEVTGYIFIFQDLTEIKRLENEIAIQKKMAAIGNFSAAIAHEIRNPLASMMGSIQVLKNQLLLNVSQKHLMDIILRESHRLDRFIANFLQYASNKKFNPRPFDLTALVRETILLFQNSPEVRPDHRFHFQPRPAHIELVGDPDQIKQVVWNLCINAVKAMPVGGEVTIACTIEDHSCTMEFRDSGRGMDEDEIQHMFEPFFGKFSGGLGLGMAIVYRIVADHGGKIAVQSMRDGGTTVRLTFSPSGAALLVGAGAV